MRRAFAVVVSVASLGGLGLGCSSSNQVTSSTAVNACATGTACGIISGGMSGCTGLALGANNPLVTAFFPITPSIVNCLGAAGSNCESARACLNGGQAPSPCTGTSGSCTGTVLNGCSDFAGTAGQRGTSQIDCGELGQMCVVATNNAGCGYGTCAGGANTCVDTKLQSCSNGIVRQFDCAPLTATCVTTLTAHCRGTGPSCQGQIGNAFFPLRCDGDVLVGCADGQEAKISCTSLALKCVSNYAGQTWACALGNACNPSSFSATCTGNVLNYCNFGVISTFDCAGAGFTRCDPANGGQCVP